MSPLISGAVWIRFPRFIGDAMMIHLALEPLRQAKLPLIAWGPDWIVDLFDGVEGYAGVQKEAKPRPGFWQNVRMLRASRPSALVNLSRSQRSLLTAFVAGVPRRVGWAASGGRLLSTKSLYFKALQGTQIERLQLLMAHAFPEISKAPFNPYVPRLESLEARDNAMGDQFPNGYIGLSVGGTTPAKRPSPFLLAALAQDASRAGYGVAALGGAPEDAALARPILDAVPGAMDLTGPMPLAYRAAWVAGAKGLISGDTGLAHIGAACGVPTVVLYGPTSPDAFFPAGPFVEGYTAPGLNCISCGQGACPLPDHPCMALHGGNDLWQKLGRLMDSASPAPIAPSF